MATIIATPGAVNANSFITEAEAIAYASETMYRPAGWVTVAGSACADTEKLALIEATRLLNLLRWQGYKTQTAQRLNWPRTWVPDPDNSIPPLTAGTTVSYDPDAVFGYPYLAADQVPQRIKDATVALAFEFIQQDVNLLPSTLGVTSQKVDVLETTWDASTQRIGLARFPRILDLINPLLDDGGLEVARS